MNADVNENKGGSFYSKSGMVLDPDLATTERMNKRAARFATAKRGRDKSAPGKMNPAKRRRVLDLSTSINNAFTIDNSENIDWSSMHIVGTSTALEKEYLRLTTVSIVDFGLPYSNNAGNNNIIMSVNFLHLR